MRANPKSAPTRLSEIVAGAEGKTREQFCSSCTRRFEQTFYIGLWMPVGCPTCIGRELEQAGAADRHLVENAAIKRAKMLEALEVPRQYAGATLDGFEMHGDDANKQRQGRNLQLARRYLAMWPERHGAELLTFPWLAIFRGAPGTGKGHVAWSLARDVAGTFGESAGFITLSDLVQDLRESWGRKDGPTEKQRLAKYRRFDLLVIDEVSSHALYGAPAQHLYQVVADREADYQATILTTNETPEGLAALIGPALESRAAAWAGPIDFGAADYRVHRQKARRAGVVR